jgi:hypothetical protein
MQGLADLAESERGVWSITVLVLTTVLVVLNKLTGEQWLDFVKYLSAALLASKTITTAVETATTKRPQREQAIPKATIVNEGAER